MRRNAKLILRTLWNQVASLFFVLLLISALISFFLGEKSDGYIISVILLINAVLGFFQEFKASKASEKLMSMVEERVYVYRGGALVQIPSGQLVMGDIVHLVPGSVAPVDLEVVESTNAFIDDSIRTGETVPKAVGMGEQVYAGASISSGKLVARVTALGEKSSIAAYRSELDTVHKWSSFGKFTESVVKYIFILSMAVLILSMILLVFVSHKYSFAHYLIFAIAMLVGVVPEILPLIVSIVLTRESMFLSRDKIIVKRLSSLESLGAVRFLLTDKTGTLTENKLRVSSVTDAGDFWEASNSVTEGEYERSAMDAAYDEALNASVGKVKTAARKIASFEPFRLDVGYEVFTLEGGDTVARGIAAKVAALSGAAVPALRSAAEYEAKGMRVIAVAAGRAGEWRFAGFAAFYDPLKPSAAASIKTAHRQGIGVKILTGDSLAVSESVAEELGLLKSPDNVLSLEGRNVADIPEHMLLRTIVFAKCTPDNKLELIDRYLRLGPVAFLGDGINDALALKRADIGIAVDNASDIAKESADIILLEKDLDPILQSVSTGRRALRNILTYIIYTLSGNAGTFFSLLVAAFFYPVLPMLPIQILLNNLLTDLPLMLIITDHPDAQALRRVPHFEPRKVLERVFIFGILSSLFDFAYFQAYKHASVAEFQTGWFVFSVLAELVLILSIRSQRSLFRAPPLSKALAAGIIVSAIVPFVFVYNRTMAGLFKFARLSPGTVGVILGITVIYIAANELAKIFIRKRMPFDGPVVGPGVFK